MMQPTTTLTSTPTMATAPKALQAPMSDLANAARVATQEIRGLGSALSLPALTTGCVGERGEELGGAGDVGGQFTNSHRRNHDEDRAVIYRKKR